LRANHSLFGFMIMFVMDASTSRWVFPLMMFVFSSLILVNLSLLYVVLHNTNRGSALVALTKVKSKIFATGVLKNQIFHFIFFGEFDDIDNSKSLLKSPHNLRYKQ
jgi:hypothetical protein